LKRTSLSAANATSEAPTAEPDEEISKPKGNRGVMWLVSGFLIFALAGMTILVLKKVHDKKVVPKT